MRADHTGTVVELDATVRLGFHTLCPRILLSVRAGEVVGLSGPSGCGKSTLLHLLVGSTPNEAVVDGTVDVAGTGPCDLDAPALRTHRRSVVALVGQDPGAELNPVLRVHALLRELRSDADVPGVLRQVRLDPALADRRVHQLSGGQQRRVALARALVREPRVLALDEPFAGLDRPTARAIGELLREAACAGVAVLLTGHDEDVLDEVCDRRVRIGEAPSALPPSPPRENRGESVLSARGLVVRSPGGVMLVDGLELDLAAGSLTALLGPSGSGKSTLLRVLQGRYRDAEGRVRVGGVDRAAGSPVPRRDARVVQRVPQDPLSTLNPSLTALSAVARAARHHPDVTSRRAATERAVQLLEQVGLGPELHTRRPSGLSGGQRQRVAVARAVAPGPDVLLCDEITSALDPDSAVAVLDHLVDVASAGTAVVVATHDEALAERYCGAAVQL